MDHTKIYNTERERLKAIRSLHPNAYALSANETIQIERINKIVIDFFTIHKEFTQVDPPDETHIMSRVHNVYNEDSVTLLKEILRIKRINLDNAYTLANRVLNGKWFEVYAAYDSLGADGYKHLAYITSDKPDVFTIAERADYPGLYEVWDNCIKSESIDKLFDKVITHYDNDPEALRGALNLSEDYLYLCAGERNILKLIKLIHEFEITFVLPQEGYSPIYNDPHITDIVAIGREAVKNSTFDDTNEIYDMLIGNYTFSTKTDPIEISDKAFANATKLLYQIIMKIVKEGCKTNEITISLKEFKEARGYKDQKEARAQLLNASGILLTTLVTVENTTKNKRGKVINTERVRGAYLKYDAEINNSKVKFTLNDHIFEVMKDKPFLWLPDSFLKISNGSPNAFTIGVRLAVQRARNIDNPEKGNRMSIKELLKSTSYPLATEIPRKRWHDQIMKPFIKALKTVAATGEFSYKFVHSRGVELTKLEEANLEYDYDLFTSCMVQVHWNNEINYYTEFKRLKGKS